MAFEGILGNIEGMLPAGSFPFVMAAIIIIGSFILAYIVLFILDKLGNIAFSRTKTTLDDKILAAVRKPVKILFVLGGLYGAIMYVSPESELLGYTVHQYFYIFFTFSIAYLIVKILESLFEWYMEEVAAKTKTKMDEGMVPLINKIIIIIVYVIAIMMILGDLGIEITPLIASLGIGGLAIALALQDTLSNFFSGLYMGIDKPIKVGDFIELENGLKGHVDKISWRATRIKMLGNNYVIIPNKKLADSIITNYDQPEQLLSVLVNLGVAYDSDLEKVEKITIDVARKVLKETEGGVTDKDPFVRYNEFGDSSINFTVIMKAKQYVNKYLITHNFIKELTRAYRENGITIPFPQTSLWFRNRLEK